MSTRGSSSGRGRGAGAMNGSGGGHGVKSGVELQLKTMSLREKLAVDGSPLVMEEAVPKPQPNPMPSNTVDDGVFNDILEGLDVDDSEAEFPIRKTLAKTNTSVYTNHFAVKIDPSIPLYEYSITGLPERVSKVTARKLVQEAIKNSPVLRDFESQFVTDYEHNIIAWAKLPQMPSVSVRSAEWKPTMDIGIHYLCQVDTDLLQRYADGKATPTRDTELRVNRVNEALNMVLSAGLDRGTFSLKANKFFMTGGHTNLSISLCAIRGYFYSVRPGMGQILLNISGCTSAFFKPILVSDFLKDTTTYKDQGERLAKLRKLRVQLTYDPIYGGSEPRSKAAIIEARLKIIAGTGGSVSEQMFTLDGRNGQPDSRITVQAYFKNTYNVTPQNSRMPAINCGTESRPKWYLPENLQILPYQVLKEMVPESMSADMLDAAMHHPATSRALVEHEGLVKLGLTPGLSMAPFPACPALKIDTRMLEIPASTLAYPKPVYASGIAPLNGPGWNLANRKLLRTNKEAKFAVFMIVVPGKDTSKSALKDKAFLEQTWKEFHGTMHNTYQTAAFAHAGIDINDEFEQSRNKAQASLQKAKGKGANFALLVLPKKSTRAYSIFKELVDRQFGMHSLCIVHDEKKGFSLQYWGNVALKMNLKAGGLNHTIKGVDKVMKHTLVLGADVTHPGPSALVGSPSIAAIVGSVDQYGGKFLGSMRVQPRDTACEDIHDVETMVLERLKDWVDANNNQLPRNILYYRDGVGNSQYSQVKHNELPQIRRAFDAAAKLLGLVEIPELKLTAYVVAKRHHVKMFPLRADAMPKNGNCKPGTLVDTAITSPYYSDFYLQSHNGLIGTARSAHYFPLVNEMGLTENDMHAFTHKLCYTYVRATLGVSYAPPAYYSDRLAERGRCYLRDFLAPGPNSPAVEAQKNLRTKLNDQAKQARESRFRHLRGSRTSMGRTMTTKSAQENRQEQIDKVAIENEIKAKTFEQARHQFYNGTVAKNPWNAKLGKTMFWM